MGDALSDYNYEVLDKVSKEKSKKIDDLSKSALINNLDKIQELVYRLKRETTTSTRYGFALLDQLHESADWRQWANE